MKDIYRILSGAMGQELRMSQTANNLANVSTTGFKKDGAMFVDYLKQQMAASASASGAGTAAVPNALPAEGDAWPVLAGNYIDFSVGELRTTGRELDLAIEGDGFLQVQVAGQQGPLYTRGGNLTMDQDGALRTISGHPVLDTNGSPITLDPQGGPVGISPTGEIRQRGAVVATLGVVDFADPTKLVKHGDGLLKAPQGVAAEAVAKPTLRQGALEGSNVNAVDEMVRMIQLERQYQLLQKAAHSIEDVTARRIDSAKE